MVEHYKGIRLSVDWENSPSTKSCLGKKQKKNNQGLIPGEQKVMGSRPVTSSQIIGERVRSIREIQKSKKVSVSGGEKRLVPLLHKYSLLWTKPRLLQRDVIVQVGKLPSGEVGDKFEAFVRITLGLYVPYQGLEKRVRNQK